MTLEFSQAEHTTNLENIVKCLNEENQLLKALLNQRHSHPEVIHEEEQRVSEPETREEV